MKKNIWFIVLLFVLVGCNSASISTSTRMVTSPTATLIQPSSTVDVLMTATKSAITQPTPEIKKECIGIDATPKNKSQGVLVFKQDWQSRLTFQDNETGKKTFVPIDPSLHVDSEYFSPNQKWLIYELDSNDPNGETKFILTKADGVQQKEIPFDRFWINISWLNNNTLRANDIDVANQAIQSFSFDPFTEKQSSLRSDFDGAVSNERIDWYIDRQAISMGLLKGTNIVYDPTLARVFYPKENNSVVLYNLETKTEIAQTTIPGWGRLPKWSPDGKNLAIVGTMSASPDSEALDEFLLISRDGPEFRRLTYLSSSFKSVRIEKYTWSTDGKNIAFWLKTDKTSESGPNPFELAIVNIESGNVTEYCIAGVPSIEFDTYSRNADITWSPDGTQLLIAQYTSTNKKNFGVVLLDLVSKTAYIITKNMYQVGWMTKEP